MKLSKTHLIFVNLDIIIVMVKGLNSRHGLCRNLSEGGKKISPFLAMAAPMSVCLKQNFNRSKPTSRYFHDKILSTTQFIFKIN